MHLSKVVKEAKRSAKAAQESSQAPDTDSEVDAEVEDEAIEESEAEEPVPLDLGDPDLDDEDAGHRGCGKETRQPWRSRLSSAPLLFVGL